MKNNYAVIMAGGVGTRLWPFSRTNYPKQFHDILGTGKSLLQQTVARFQDICPIENVYIVTNEIYKDLVKEQLPLLKDDQILLEPVKRNTAPCIAYASYKIAQQNPAANMVVAPADQVILQEDKFTKALHMALEATASREILVTLGIKPTRPDTGYGYIQFSAEDAKEVKKVQEFKEKPVLEIAQQYVDSGQYVWNAGIFIWNAQSIQKAFAQFMPEIDAAFKEVQSDYYQSSEANAIHKVYTGCQSESIDIGVMDCIRLTRLIIIRLDFLKCGINFGHKLSEGLLNG
ncbi:MAG: mannose-1-phosphate guanylyltransferase, partial [Bacteroidota bacterium]